MEINENTKCNCNEKQYRNIMQNNYTHMNAKFNFISKENRNLYLLGSIGVTDLLIAFTVLWITFYVTLNHFLQVCFYMVIDV